MSVFVVSAFLVAGCRVGQALRRGPTMLSASVRLLWHDETAWPAVSRGTGRLDY